MSFSVRGPSRVFATLGAGLALALTTRAAESLATRSPFLPPPSAAPAAPTKDATIELRGIMESAEGPMFSIYDATRHTSAWSRLNETGLDFVVRSYDSAKDTVTVDYQGRALTLALRTAKIVSAPANAGGPPAPPAATPVGGPVVLHPTAADEQRRLEAIAAEVNRRRLLRQQALQQGNRPR
jgi:hypothetical protein